MSTTLTAVDVTAREQELNRMILEGRAMEAFERFYAEDVVMQEDAEEPVRGKNANREREKEFFSKVTDFRGAELRDVAVNEDHNVTMSAWSWDFTHEDWGDVRYDQVAVRHWNDEGQVRRERFFKAA